MPYELFVFASFLDTFLGFGYITAFKGYTPGVEELVCRDLLLYGAAEDREQMMGSWLLG